MANLLKFGFLRRKRVDGLMQHFCSYMFSANYHGLCIYPWHMIIYAKTKFHTQQLGNIYTPQTEILATPLLTNDNNWVIFWNIYAKLCSDSVLRLGGGARQLTWSMLVIVNLQKLENWSCITSTGSTLAPLGSSSIYRFLRHTADRQKHTHTQHLQSLNQGMHAAVLCIQQLMAYSIVKCWEDCSKLSYSTPVRITLQM